MTCVKATDGEATYSTIAHLYLLERLFFFSKELRCVLLQKCFHSMKLNSGQGIGFWEGGEMHFYSVKEKLVEIVEA